MATRWIFKYSLSVLICFTFVNTSCGSPSTSINVHDANATEESWQVSLNSFFNIDDDYKVMRQWYKVRDSLDLDDPSNIKKWLNFQQKILNNTNKESSNSSVIRGAAIQEFGLFIEYASLYEDWLKECKTSNKFVVPLVVQNLDMILGNLEKNGSRIKCAIVDGVTVCKLDGWAYKE